MAATAARTAGFATATSRREEAWERAFGADRFVVGASGTLLECSPFVERQLGLTPEQAGAPFGWLMGLHEDDRAAVQAAFEAAVAKLGSFELRKRRARGGLVRVRAVSVPDDRGGAAEVAVEISPADAPPNLQLLAEVLRQLPVGVTIHFADGSVLRNDHMQGAVGTFREPYDVLRTDGTPLDRVAYPLYRAWRGETVRDERVLFRQHGASSFRLMQLCAAPVYDAEKHIVAVVGTLLDVTDRARAESEFETLAETLPALVWSTGLDGRADYLNRIGRAFFGDEMASAYESWLERTHPDDRAAVVAEWSKAVAEARPFAWESRARGPDGEYRWLRGVGTPRIEHGRVVGFVGASFDITEHRTATEELQRVAAFAEQLIGIIGHDLRDPFTSIQLSAALLRAGELRTDQQKPVSRIVAAVERGMRILETLLDFTQARIGRGIQLRRARMDLTALCDELSHDHALGVVAFEPHPPCVGNWDRARLEQLLGNLLRNAVEHGARGEPVAVRIRDTGSIVSLSVHNRGEPIPDAVMPTLFEPYKRGERAPGSRNLGLGLYIVKQIALAHGGDVAATSSAAEGTTFTVTLPR